MHKRMVFFGIDPGIAITGWGVVEDDSSAVNRLRMVEFGVVTTEKSIPHIHRLNELQKDMSALLKEFSPDVIAIEKLFFAKNTKTALTVGEARGVVLAAIAEMDVPVEEYTPPQIKSAVCGFGNAPKKQVQEMVQSILEMDSIPTPDDAADALAVAVCAASGAGLYKQVISAHKG